MALKDPSQDPRYIKAVRALEEAVQCHRSGRIEEADQLYGRLVKKNPDYFDGLNLYGLFSYQQGRLPKALELFKKAVRINPRSVNALSNLGVAFCGLRQVKDGLAAFDRALALDPGNVQTLNNRGNALAELNRLDEALAAFEGALKANPGYGDAHINRGRLLLRLGRHRDALASYDQALALAPDNADVHNNRGGVLQELGRLDEALASFDRAIRLRADHANAHSNRGTVLSQLGRYDEAVAAYDRTLALKPDDQSAAGDRMHARMHLCDWSGFEAERARHVAAIRQGRLTALPFVFLAISPSAEDQLQCARLCTAAKFPPAATPVWTGERYDHDRIRVAYLSADFREHPVAYALAGVIEHHDRARFETVGMSFGPDSPGEMRARLTGAFDRLMDVRDRSHLDVARLLRSLEIDIAVDLMGHTRDARPAIFAHRGAPVQALYLGYSGTTGSGTMDYVIADATVIPEAHRQWFTEKVARLPDSFMPNDARRPIAERVFTRADMGLPPAGFVFCCFNNSYKLNPDTFGAWMRILQGTPGSVLWVNESNATASANLKRFAAARGVSPDRLVFAQRMPSNADHLARLRLGDLFLDTLPYNAHSTTGDALWAGLPVLTCEGNAFAGRVAASMLHAVGLPELVTTTPQAYEALATGLAANPDRLADIKRKLAANRLTAPLFDTASYTRQLEAAYAAMHARHRAGLPPDDIAVLR